MAEVNHIVRAHGRRVDARAKPLASALTLWLGRYSRVLVDRELRRTLRKNADDERFLTELERILRLYGARTLTEAGTIGDTQIEAKAVDDFLRMKTVAVQGILDETRDAVRDDIKRTIGDALNEQPTPSPGEIARRIRSSYFGPEDARPFAVSSERAATIARTEITQAQNSGQDAAYRATASATDEYEWLSHKGPYASGPRRPGDRHHDKLDGVRVKVGDYFVTPLGNRLRYPGDPTAPIEELANCRCAFRLVRSANP